MTRALPHGLLLLALALWVWWVYRETYTSNDDECPLRGGTCRAPPLLLSENLLESDPIAIPLHYHLGVFELDLWLGNQPLRAVFDTGSERLIVASNTCQACDKESGIYHVSDNATVRRKSTISYGTQEDRVHWLEEELALPHMGPLGCQQLHYKPQQTTRVLHKTLEIGAVYHRSGQSNLNVIGFSQCYPNETASESSVLPTICGSAPHFALMLVDDFGWLVLRPDAIRPCFDCFRAPLVRLPDNKYYVVALAGVAAVDPATGAGRPGRRAPRYAIIDSGSNMLSVSSSLLRELEEGGVAEGGARNLEISIQTSRPDAPGALTYTPAQYTMGAQLLIRDNLPLGKDDAEDFLLLGSLFLRGLYLEFDVTGQSVLFGTNVSSLRPGSAARTQNTPPPISVQQDTRIPHAGSAKKS